MTQVDGWSPEDSVYKKFAEKVNSHENTPEHRNNYIQWQKMKRNEEEGTIDSLLLKDFIKETNRWRSILKRILDVTLFLAERGLAFRGDEEVLGSPHNGNFLGFREVLAKYDPVLEEHLSLVLTEALSALTALSALASGHMSLLL